jgi:hypothetical protein
MGAFEAMEATEAERDAFLAAVVTFYATLAGIHALQFFFAVALWICGTYFLSRQGPRIKIALLPLLWIFIIVCFLFLMLSALALVLSRSDLYRVFKEIPRCRAPAFDEFAQCCERCTLED